MPTFDSERKLHNQGFLVIAGVDEVGRGSLAGPVVAASVIFPHDIYAGNNTPDLPWANLIDDSKKLTHRQRLKAQSIIEHYASAVSLGIAECREIDSLGIVEATRMAMARSIDQLLIKPDHLMLDYVKPWHHEIPLQVFIRGDSISYSIAAASIIAKIFRDSIMNEAALDYPEYGFDKHKGYATEEHRRHLERLGPSPIHRMSFGQLKSEMKGQLRFHFANDILGNT